MLCRSVRPAAVETCDAIQVRVIGPEEVDVWADVSARGWSHEHPELSDFLRRFGVITAARAQVQPSWQESIVRQAPPVCYACTKTLPSSVAAPQSRSCAAAGSRPRTPPYAHALRVRSRLRSGYEWSRLGAATSQRNAERAGFQIADTCTKWGLR